MSPYDALRQIASASVYQSALPIGLPNRKFRFGCHIYICLAQNMAQNHIMRWWRESCLPGKTNRSSILRSLQHFWVAVRGSALPQHTHNACKQLVLASLPFFGSILEARTLHPSGQMVEKWSGRIVCSLKRHKVFASYKDLDCSPYTGCKADNCTHNAHSWKANPFTLPFWHLCLPNVNLKRKKNCKRPEAHRPYQGHHIAESN